MPGADRASTPYLLIFITVKSTGVAEPLFISVCLYLLELLQKDKLAVCGGKEKKKTGAHAAAAQQQEVMFQKLLAGCLLSHIHAIKCRVFQSLFLPLL